MSTSPQMTALEQSAAYLHEWFCSLTAAGFTEDQAIKFCVQMTMQQPGESEDG